MSAWFSFAQLTAATDRINSLWEEQEQLRNEKESIQQCSQKKEEVRKHLQLNLSKLKRDKSCTACYVLMFQAALQDSQVELETYKQTRQGLDEMYNVVWKQYKEEKRIRQVRYQHATKCVVDSTALRCFLGR